MRLALLSPLPPEQTGIADYAAQLRRALNEAGVEVLTPLQGQKPIDSLAAARRWIAERDWSGVDVVHAELGGGRIGEFFVLSALSRMAKRPALSATAHDPERLVWRPVHAAWPAIERSRLLPRLTRQALAVLSDPHTLWAERRLAKRIDGLVTLTETGGARLARRMGVPRSKLSVIPHGTLPIAPLPLPPHPPVRLLYFGFIYAGKGIEDLIDALGRLVAAHPDLGQQVRLTIAGGTSPDITFGAKTSYLDGLRQRVSRRGLEQVVEWGLDVDARDIPHLVQTHHVMVLPYRESLKLSLLGQMRGTSGALAWAIACERGAITSNARSFAEEIESGNGQSYKQGDVAALAQAIEGLLQEPQRVHDWAHHAALLAKARNWGTTGERFRAHFQAAIERHTGQPWRNERTLRALSQTRQERST
jgi:polysaccharide biosynthesis protein PslF